MANEIVAPVLNIAELQEVANKAAMDAAKSAINSFYNGYNSPFKKAVEEYLENNVPSIHFELPNLMEEVQKALLGEIERFSNETNIKNCVAALRKGLTRLPLEEDGSIKLSSVFEEMEYEIDTENGDYIEAEVSEAEEPYRWMDVNICIHKGDDEKNIQMTLHRNEKYIDGEFVDSGTTVLLSMPYSRYDSKTAKIKIKDHDAEIEMPIFHGLADNYVLMTIAKLVMYKTPIVVDCKDYRTNNQEY